MDSLYYPLVAYRCCVNDTSFHTSYLVSLSPEPIRNLMSDRYTDLSLLYPYAKWVEIVGSVDSLDCYGVSCMEPITTPHSAFVPSWSAVWVAALASQNVRNGPVSS